MTYEQTQPKRQSPEEAFQHRPVHETVEIVPAEVKPEPDLFEKIGEDRTFVVDLIPPKLVLRLIGNPYRMERDWDERNIRGTGRVRLRTRDFELTLRLLKEAALLLMRRALPQSSLGKACRYLLPAYAESQASALQAAEDFRQSRWHARVVPAKLRSRISSLSAHRSLQILEPQ